MAVTSIDPDVEFWNIVNRISDEKDKRIRQPVVKLLDGDWVLRGRVAHLYTADFSEVEWDTGIGKIEMPADYYLSEWITDHEERDTQNVHISVEKDGVRWTGRMDHWEIDVKDGKDIVRVVFKHDYEELKHILCWANPFLPPEVQFPKVFLLFGQARWILKTALFCNILRLEADLWQMPDNPLDIDEWTNPGNPLDQSNWSMVVKPDLTSDASPLGIFYSRFKTFDAAAKDIGEDAQITPTFRRYLTGDEPPWPGADLRNGCLVIDFEDKSGWNTGTSFGGSLFTGLIHALVNIGSSGHDEGIDILPDPIFPPEYYEPGFKGTLPQAPGIIYRQGEHTGIQTSLFKGSPAKDVQHVTGGHSMPGVACALL